MNLYFHLLTVIFSTVLLESSLADFNLTPNNEIIIQFEDDDKAINVTYKKGDDIRFLGIISRTIGAVYDLTSSSDSALLNFLESDVQLKISSSVDTSNNVKISLEWTAGIDAKLEDCFALDPYKWFGGPEQKYQYWPIEKLTLKQYSYVTKEDDSAAIVERYWGNSGGIIYYVNKRAPLFIDQNNDIPGYLCFVSEVKKPYSKSRTVNELSYDIVITENARTAHMYAVQHYLGKPIDIPDFRMIQHPIWSTWARYYRKINDTIVMNYAREILDYGFKNSQFEIDDLWEVCYGSLTIDTNKFPDMKKTVDDLKSLGFRVTLWIHPFINQNCEPYYTNAKDKGFLVQNEDGSYSTSWWNSNITRASHFDFTNPEAKTWWIDQLKELKAKYGFDSFKFDAGETSWLPQIPKMNSDINEHPNQFTIDYVRAVAELGPMIEIRTGFNTQDLPVFVRMLDKTTSWTFNNGLPTLITTLLQMNMNGYPFVLPDMIGGNGYLLKPSKEIFIRWFQANVFMPSMQYSFVPWNYDDETIQIAHFYTNLHAEYANLIRDAMIKSVELGTPVNAPIWWIEPDNLEAFDIYDEFLLGEDILVAPIIEKEAVTRDIYLPEGVWFYQNKTDSAPYNKGWIYDFPAPLDVLPYFVRSKNV